MESAIWGFIGTAIGAAASIFTTYLTNLHAEKLDSQSHAMDRMEKSRAFQRETLLALQEAFNDAMRNITRAHLEDLASHASGKEWGKSLLSKEVDENVRLSNKLVLLYVERASDEALRSTVKSAMQEANHILHTTSRHEADVAFKNVIAISAKVNEEIGKTLRAHY